MNSNVQYPAITSAEPAQSRNLSLRESSGHNSEGLGRSDSMQIEEVKGYISNTIDILSKCLRTTFQGVKDELNQINDLGSRLENGLNQTLDKIEEQDALLSNHELMLKNIINAAQLMFDRQIQKNTELDEALLKVSQYFENLNNSIEKANVLNNQLMIDGKTTEQKLNILLKRDQDSGSLESKFVSAETQMKALVMKFNLIEERDIPKIRANAESFNLEKSDIYSRLLVLEERFQKLEGLITISTENVNFSKSDKKKLNELQNNVIDLQRWKSQAQDTLDNLRRDQIKEREVDSKIKTLLAKEIHPKIDQMSQKIGILGKDAEESSELFCGVEDLRNRNDLIEKWLKKIQDKNSEDDLCFKDLKSQLEEVSMKIVKLDAKEQFMPDQNKLEQNLKRMMEETEKFKDISKFTDIIEDNKKLVNKKIDDIKQKVEKIERGCFLNIQTQVDILRDKIGKLGDAQNRSNKELNSLTQELEDGRKNLEKTEIGIDYKKIIDETSAIIDSKLQNYTETIESNLAEISRQQRITKEAPLTNFEGKKYLYVDEKGAPIDRKDVRIAIDGSAILKERNTQKYWSQDSEISKNKCTYGSKCDRVFCKRDHGEKICPWDSRCTDPKCQLRHLSLKASARKPSKCKLKDNCPDARCPFHDKESCRGFIHCKKNDCRRRHHPSRAKPQRYLEKRKTEKEKLPINNQLPFYLYQPSAQSPSQFALPFYSPYQGHPYSYPALTHQWSWFGKGQE